MPSAKTITIFTLAVSLLSLSAAFIAQYGFGLIPCELCVMQRIPYAIIIFLSLLGIFAPRFRFTIIIIIMFSFIAGGSIATYHSAVEKHWIAGPVACTSEKSPTNQSMDDFLKKIEQAPIVACDQPQWSWHGITMAVLNALWSFCIVILLAVFMMRKKRSTYA